MTTVLHRNVDTHCTTGTKKDTKQ